MDRDPTKAELLSRAAQLEQELAAVKAELSEERARRIAAEQVVLRMKRDIERLERQLMGPKSERILDPEEQPVPDPPEGDQDEEPEAERRRAGPGVRPVPASR